MSTSLSSCQYGLVPEFTKPPFLRFLNLSGDGTPTNSAIIADYSGAVTDFFFQVPSGFIFRIATILVSISCSASINQGDYGSIVGGLVNGVKLIQRINGVETQLIGGITVKKNYEFLASTHDTNITQFAANAQTLQIAFETFLDLGTYIDLHGNTNDRLIFRVNDNFTGLVDQRVVIRGLRT